jgi:hypothetical protein
MMSSPSAATQRVYGDSFSVANFFARSSDTNAFFAMPYSTVVEIESGGTVAGGRPW